MRTDNGERYEPPKVEHVTGKALLGLATTRELLEELEVRMRVTQNSTKGRELGVLCAEALQNLTAGVLDYRTAGSIHDR